MRFFRHPVRDQQTEFSAAAGDQIGAPLAQRQSGGGVVVKRRIHCTRGAPIASTIAPRDLVAAESGVDGEFADDGRSAGFDIALAMAQRRKFEAVIHGQQRTREPEDRIVMRLRKIALAVGVEHPHVRGRLELLRCREQASDRLDATMQRDPVGVVGGHCIRIVISKPVHDPVRKQRARAQRSEQRIHAFRAGRIDDVDGIQLRGPGLVAAGDEQDGHQMMFRGKPAGHGVGERPVGRQQQRCAEIAVAAAGSVQCRRAPFVAVILYRPGSRRFDQRPTGDAAQFRQHPTVRIGHCQIAFVDRRFRR